MDEQIPQTQTEISNNFEEPKYLIMASKPKYLILISLALILLSIVLNWIIPDDAGLVAGMYVILYASIVGVIGIVLTGIFLWLKKTPRRIKNISLLVFSWILLPVVVGPILSMTLLVSLYSYYDSNQFTNNYLSKLGITIEPQGQNFEYAYCKLEKYIARYKIANQSDVDLIFSQVDANGITYANKDLLSESLSKQFEFVSESFVRRGVVSTIGIFKIPKGIHTVELKGDRPFLLAIYYPKPLLTPQLFLLEEKDYPNLYADNFTQSDFEVASQTARDQSCQGNQINRPDIINYQTDSIDEMLDKMNNDYFLNQYVHIPNTKINLYKGSDRELYLYNQWGGNSGLDESHLLSISETATSSPALTTEGELYKTITNHYSKQHVNIFLTIVKKNDPHRPPYLPVVDYDNFLEQIKSKDGLNEDDLKYLNRTGAYFWPDKSLQFDNLHLKFNDYISPFNILKVIEVIENIEPSKIYSKDIDL